MTPEQANKILDEFPELSRVLTKLKESDKFYKREFGDPIIMAVLSAISERDGDILAIVDRLEHLVNKELNKAENGLNVLAALSRLRFKVNRFLDSQK